MASNAGDKRWEFIPKLDETQRRELVEFVRTAPSTDLGLWLKQCLPEHGGNSHVPSHMNDVAAALLPTMASAISDLRERAEELDARVD